MPVKEIIKLVKHAIIINIPIPNEIDMNLKYEYFLQHLQ